MSALLYAIPEPGADTLVRPCKIEFSNQAFLHRARRRRKGVLPVDGAWRLWYGIVR